MGNDADVQGYGAIQGQGVELVLTLGTGMGSALFTNGHLCPGLELGHHPWRKKRPTRTTWAAAAWTSTARSPGTSSSRQAIAQTAATFNWDHLYLGGGNTKKIDFEPRTERHASSPTRPAFWAAWRFGGSGSRA